MVHVIYKRSGLLVDPLGGFLCLPLPLIVLFVSLQSLTVALQKMICSFKLCGHLTLKSHILKYYTHIFSRRSFVYTLLSNFSSTKHDHVFKDMPREHIFSRRSFVLPLLHGLFTHFSSLKHDHVFKDVPREHIFSRRSFVYTLLSNFSSLKHDHVFKDVPREHIFSRRSFFSHGFSNYSMLFLLLLLLGKVLSSSQSLFCFYDHKVSTCMVFLQSSLQSSQFLRDLTMDGDIESNPGPFVTEEGITTLKPSVWLDDSVVDFYGEYITESSELCQFFRIGNLHAAVSYGDFDTLALEFRNVQNSMRETGERLLFIPINDGVFRGTATHWTLLVCDIDSTSFFHLNQCSLTVQFNFHLTF
ncbi:hypothetical protein GEMRC1_005362 [Eukaryota sp. GEM-RC1]